jgi:hypothetical protein
MQSGHAMLVRGSWKPPWKTQWKPANGGAPPVRRARTDMTNGLPFPGRIRGGRRSHPAGDQQNFGRFRFGILLRSTHRSFGHPATAFGGITTNTLLAKARHQSSVRK